MKGGRHGHRIGVIAFIVVMLAGVWALFWWATKEMTDGDWHEVERELRRRR